MAPPAIFDLDFEFGVGLTLTPANEAAQERFGVDFLEAEDLPVSDALRDRAARLSSWHAAALNQAYPPDPSPWREEECDRFNRAVDAFLVALRAVMPENVQVVNRYEPLHEDPDLDRYLANPRGFTRER